LQRQWNSLRRLRRALRGWEVRLLRGARVSALSILPNHHGMYGCIDMKQIGGASCTTSTNGCSGQGACPNIDWSTPKVCRCFDDFVCPNCQMTTAEYIQNNYECSSYNYTNIQTGGGPCESPADCTNFQGECIDGKCACHSDRACPNCQSSIWEVDKLGCVDYSLQGGNPCESYADCSDPNGKCVDGRCLCYTGYMCPQCTMSNEQYIAANETCTWIQYEPEYEPIDDSASHLQLAGLLGIVAVVNYVVLAAFHSY